MLHLAQRVLAGVLFTLALVTWTPAAYANDDADRAAALKQHGLTLDSCLKKAADESKGVPVFANVHIGKRGNFGVNIDCVLDKQKVGVGVDSKGKATRKAKTERDRGNEADYPKIAQEFADQKVTLAELVVLAEQEMKGTAINAWGYVKDDQVLVRVIVVAKQKNDQGATEEQAQQVVLDPRTRKVVK